MQLEKLRQNLGSALREESKHHEPDGRVCAKCGAEDRPLATHVSTFLDGNPGVDPRSWVPQATSYAPDRGGIALCNKCAPPCRKCQQPVLAGATRKWLKSQPGFKLANGYCSEHIRILGLTF